jgi:hypothetical protein
LQNRYSHNENQSFNIPTFRFIAGLIAEISFSGFFYSFLMITTLKVFSLTEINDIWTPLENGVDFGYI